MKNKPSNKMLQINPISEKHNFNLSFLNTESPENLNLSLENKLKKRQRFDF